MAIFVIMKRVSSLEARKGNDMIYLDYNATTPTDKEVAEAMLPYLYGNFGNPSSEHALGVKAKNAIEQARGEVAGLLHAFPKEIVFTGCASESNNMVLKGVAHSLKEKGNHIITSKIEHPSILEPCKYLEEIGFEVSYVSVDEYGLVDPKEIEKLMTDKTILVSIMHSNNETGTMQPIKEIALICQRHQVLFHTDASQAMGKVPVDVKDLGVDFLTLAGHKLYAPKGIGALYIREGIQIESLLHGAGHESGRRAGTESILLEVGLGKACAIAADAMKTSEVKFLTEYFYQRLKDNIGEGIHLNGHPELRLPNTLNISFIGFNGHEILNKLNDVAASTGSACHSGMTSLSPVLSAMGVSEEIGRGAIRFSLGRYTTKEEVDQVMEELKNVINGKKESGGNQMKLGIIIETKEYEKAWNAMRFAVASKKKGHEVKVFLMGEAVEIENLSNEKYDVGEQVALFHEIGGTILACGTCLKSRDMEGSEACPLSTMIDCVELVEWADKMVTF